MVTITSPAPAMRPWVTGPGSGRCRQTNPGLRSANQLTSPRARTSPAMVGSSSGARSRATFASARRHVSGLLMRSGGLGDGRVVEVDEAGGLDDLPGSAGVVGSLERLGPHRLRAQGGGRGDDGRQLVEGAKGVDEVGVVRRVPERAH